MRQRNDTDQPLFAHTDPPQVVGPGVVIDYPDVVVGLTVLDEPAPLGGPPPAEAATPDPPATEDATAAKPTKSNGKKETTP